MDFHHFNKIYFCILVHANATKTTFLLKMTETVHVFTFAFRLQYILLQYILCVLLGSQRIKQPFNINLTSLTYYRQNKSLLLHYWPERKSVLQSLFGHKENYTTIDKKIATKPVVSSPTLA